MNSLESALLTGFISVSCFAYFVNQLYVKVVGINNKLVSDNRKFVHSIEERIEEISIENKLCQDLYKNEGEVIVKTIHTDFSSACHRMSECNPVQQAQIYEYQYIIIHDVYKDAIAQIGAIAESEKCWIEPIINSVKNINLRAVVDVALFSEERENLDFVKYLITNRLDEISYHSKSEIRVPMSIREIRRNQCINCDNMIECLGKISNLDFECPLEKWR